jgi:hypothetical protein
VLHSRTLSHLVGPLRTYLRCCSRSAGTSSRSSLGAGATLGQDAGIVAARTAFLWLPLALRPKPAVSPGAALKRAWLERESGGGWDSWRSPVADGVDDLAGIDPLQIGRCRTKVGMAQLTLDDVDRNALAAEFDRMRVAQLVLVPTSAQPSLGRPGRYADLG